MQLSRQQRDRLEVDVDQLARSGGVERLRKVAQLAGLATDQVRRVLERSAGTEGTLDAQIVPLVLPRRDVRRLLPAGLELAPQPLVMPDRHPVFFSFSHERFDPWLGEMNYHELMFGIPWVQLADPHVRNRGPFIYMPRLYLDDSTARRLGSLLYGLEQQPARFETSGERHAVHADEGDALLVEGTFTDPGSVTRPPLAPGFALVRQMFEQPTISQGRRIFDPHAFHHHAGGPFLASINHYGFDADDAELTPVRATVRIGGDFDPAGFPTGSYAVEPLSDTALGAFRIRVRQRMSLPQSCSDARYPEPPPPPKRQRVVVLGGGPSSCAAAFYLAKTGRYQVSMYTLGYRLGGKCAAGRNPDAADRIEEHGLHAFVGFYNNAFRTVREVYEQAGLELSRGKGPWTVEDLARGDGPVAAAFRGTHAVGLMGKGPTRGREPSWTYFPTTLPINDAVPGEVPHESDEDGPNGFARAMKITLTRAIAHARELRGWAPGAPGDAGPEPPDLLDRVLDRIGVRFGPSIEIEQWTLYKMLERALGYFERHTFEEITRAISSNAPAMRVLARMLRRLRRLARRRFADKIEVDADRWFEWSGLDVMLTIAIGILTDRVTHFDQIDHIDFADWLRVHGVSPNNTRSPVVTAIYDTLFSNGTSEPVRADNLAAGVGLRWFLLLLDYRGFQAYEFCYSCPQSLFSPYYTALRKLGVSINFFHRVESLDVERRGDQRELTGVTFCRQATVKGGPDRYNPLWRKVEGNPDGFAPWPNAPDYDQLQEGRTLAGVNLEDAWDPRARAGKQVT
ncbi:MAG: NAD(P)-binding protein, partial [Deltaproteobacteria bacterium]|nr:NAD(P)-binding protein [Deltaproteobacteria bacterium]